MNLTTHTTPELPNTTQHVTPAHLQRLTPHLLRAERIQRQRMGFDTTEWDIEIERRRVLSLDASARLAACAAEIIREMRR